MIVAPDDRHEAAWQRCLRPSGDPLVEPGLSRKRAWAERARQDGLVVRVALDAVGAPVGFIQAMPVETVPWVDGEDLLMILCLRVPEGPEAHHGHGRALIDAVQRQARADGRSGLVAWASRGEGWQPASFYRHLGFRQVDHLGETVLMLRPVPGAVPAPPRLRAPPGPNPPVSTDGPVEVVSHCAGWCTLHDAVASTAEQVVAERPDAVFTSVDAWSSTSGATGCDRLLVDGVDLTRGAPPDARAIDRRITHASRRRRRWWPFGR